MEPLVHQLFAILVSFIVGLLVFTVMAEPIFRLVLGMTLKPT